MGINTITHLETGFSFDGDTIDEKMKDFISSFYEVLDIYNNDRKQWEGIRKAAKKE